MQIIKIIDRDIEEQAEKINSRQKESRETTNTPSVDVETMKLKRMIDKRSQMFDMLRQIMDKYMDKYNETAKGIIDSIGR